MVVVLSPRVLVDPDALSHLATGRWIVETGEVPHSDPFTFPRPHQRWSNPEWLGDTAWWWTWAVGDEFAVQVVKFAAVFGGLLLSVRLAATLGAPALLCVPLFLFLLPASVARFTVRNHIHALWLIPAYAMLVAKAHRHRGWWLLILAIGWLWSNVHSSFVLGWVVLGCALIQRAIDRLPVDWRPALAVLAAHLIFPALGPQGVGAYGQIIDHLIGAPIYRQFITEWRSPLASPALLALLPFYGFWLVAFASFLWKQNRRQVGPVLMVVVGCGMAMTSRRFIPIAAVMSVPFVAANLWRSVNTWSLRGRRLAWIGLVVVAAGYLGVATYARLRQHQNYILERSSGSSAVAAFIGVHAPTGGRVFNAYNLGPYLMWHAAPRVQHYIDPRNNLGARFLRHYATVVLPSPENFEREAIDHKITLALVSLSDARFNTLVEHLDTAAAWQLVFLDGRRALFARRIEANRVLVGRYGYRFLRARHGFAAFNDAIAHNPDGLERDIKQLRRQAPAVLTRALEQCVPAIAGRSQSAADLIRTVSALRNAMSHVPATTTLLACGAVSLGLLGERQASIELLTHLEKMSPTDRGVRELGRRLRR